MTGPDHHAEMESHYATGRELSEALMRVAELEAENARLREEWAQEGIGWLRDKDIDRLMGVEDENKRLTAECNRLRIAACDFGGKDE